MKLSQGILWFYYYAIGLACWSTDAWVEVSPLVLSRPSSFSPAAPHRQKTSSLYDNNNNNEKGGAAGFFDFLNPYESKIPAELRDEIYAAEANTPAAKERGQRVALYALLAFCGILTAFFNGFLTEIRANGPDGNGVDLSLAGFDWVVNNPLWSFLFLNKIGGGIALLGGAGAGLLAEAELDTKRINAEKIYEELERRRAAKANKSKPKPSTSSSSKKRRSGKESKRLVALSEVMEQEKEEEEMTKAVDEVATKEPEPTAETPKDKKEEGILGSLKSLYDKADTMAASQALLLNKKLEEVGVVEKITDETGLKVIGREEAAKLKEKQKSDDQQQ